jgi:hypothetical protein
MDKSSAGSASDPLHRDRTGAADATGSVSERLRDYGNRFAQLFEQEELRECRQAPFHEEPRPRTPGTEIEYKGEATHGFAQPFDDLDGPPMPTQRF